ncbi:MAG: DUF3592 domain-containing protein [Gemmatimonadaceae bacterium]|nr:DUF3592 domain-containing protein [Gloeobacterales cyanobacterium ES-bin-141]
MLIIAVGVWATFTGATEWVRGVRSEPWPIVQGTVLSSYVEIKTRKGQRFYRPQVVYRYVVRGVAYTSSNYSFGNPTILEIDFRLHAQAVVKGHPPGQPTAVHYDPEYPEVSVLKPGVHSSSFGMVGVGVSGLVIAFVLWLLREF